MGSKIKVCSFVRLKTGASFWLVWVPAYQCHVKVPGDQVVLGTEEELERIAVARAKSCREVIDGRFRPQGQAGDHSSQGV